MLESQRKEGARPNIELFAERVFGVNCDALNRHFVNTRDRTIWYRVSTLNEHNVMYSPGMDVIRVNPLELDKFLAAAESFIKFPITAPEFDWEHLNIFEYGGADVERGLHEVIDVMSANAGCLVACDTETRYLNWDGNKLLSIGFATSNDTCYAMYNIPTEQYGLLQHALNIDGVRYAWHNGKYDKNFLRYTCGISARVDEDSMLKHFSQVSEKKGTHGLKYLGPLYLRAPQWDDELDAMKKKYCKEHKIKLAEFTYDLIPTRILVPYMARDCIATRRLIGVFDAIKEPGTDRVYKTLIEATEAFSNIEINGACVDTDHLNELQEMYNSQLISANGRVTEAVNKLWNPVNYSNETGAKFSPEFSLTSPKKLKWLLKAATGVEVDSSDAATIEKLNEFVEDGTLKVDGTCHELFKGIMESRKAGKYLDTYVTGMNTALRKDGRVSGSYLLHGTETGRLSCQKPNMQNIPRNKDVKNIFCATKGYKLVQLDYSQAELRVLGVLSKDPFLISSYKEGKDLHANVARQIFGEDFTSEQRTMAKTVNFGIAYGRGAGAISEAFKLSRQEAQKIIDDWFGAMPKVREYINAQRRAAREGARQQTMFGRVRHYVVNDENLFHVENEYINTPIQSMASDLTVNSIIEINKWLIAKGYYDPLSPMTAKARIIITVHDSIVLEVIDEDTLVREVAEHCQNVMAQVPEEMIPDCPLPFKADVEVGYSWGKLKEPEDM